MAPRQPNSKVELGPLSQGPLGCSEAMGRNVGGWRAPDRTRKHLCPLGTEKAGQVGCTLWQDIYMSNTREGWVGPGSCTPGWVLGTVYHTAQYDLVSSPQQPSWPMYM